MIGITDMCTINDETFVLSIASLHNLKDVGVSISHKYADENRANVKFRNNVLYAFGFVSDDDYVNCYPSKYIKNSYCRPPLQFGPSIDNPRNDNFYYAFTVCSYTGVKLDTIKRDFKLLMSERLNNNTVIFPLTRDITENLNSWTDKNSIEKYDLWFCLDWSE